ncbi:MAG TPA: hypothetical protein V6D07_18535 [Trichocoleus sp.]
MSQIVAEPLQAEVAIAPAIRWRVTRNRPYPPGTVGHTDLSARQGHYSAALTAEDAIAEIDAQFKEREFGYQVQKWS